MSNIYENINNLYNKKGFTEKYGSEIWITIITLLVFFIATTYFYAMNNIKPIVADWENQRCNPAVMPFAGLINNGKNTTPLEFTGQNFTSCVQGILTNITAYAFQPFYYLMKTMTDAFSELGDAVNGIRSEFDKIRNSIKNFSTETMGRTLNITLPIVQMLISIKDMGAKVIGTLSASLYTLMGSYLTMKSLFLFIVDLIVKILIILAGIIVCFLIIAAIPIFGSWAIPVAAVNIAIMIAILIPTIMIKIFMDDIMNLSTPNTPSVPRCFSEHTLIKTKDGRNIKISDIKVNDVLEDNSIVTGIMKLSSDEQDMFNLGGIIVSGEHRIYYDNTLGYINVKNHPDSQLVEKFYEPYLYCLTTNTKCIPIGEYIFSDWDDIDANVIEKLNKNCVSKGYIPKNFKYEDIHYYLDNGLHRDTPIKLKNGHAITIDKIKVNDILNNGGIVLAVIKIDATKIKGLYEYKLEDGSKICCSGNINLNNYLGGINTFNLYGKQIYGEEYLYQLLTTTGTFNVNNLNVGDYNTGIDKFIFN
jgi:hypothetical protein